MLTRLVIGLIKGLILGGLLGFALAKIGFAAPGFIIAYLGAAIAGALVGLIAGKPIWAKEAKVEAGMKAFFGALLAGGLMYAARRWLTWEVPLDLSALGIGELGGANESLAEVGTGTFGGLAITSLAMVTAVLGGFYEADNTPEAEGTSDNKAAGAKKDSNVRIAAAADDDALADEEAAMLEPDAESAKRKKR
jgi:hypothetical protein